MQYFILAVVIAAAAAFVYARFIEPGLLAVKRFAVENAPVEQSIKIAAFSDIHIGLGGMGSRRFEKITAAIERENPDMVVFLGDFYYNYARYGDKDRDRLARALSLPGLQNAEKYAVRGNHDMPEKANQAFGRMFDDAGWDILVNASRQSMGINIIGSDDAIFGRPDIDGLVREGSFNLLLVHEPDVADMFAGVQLQLSGHTHGGQVRLPFAGAAVLPRLGRKYILGTHQKACGGTVIVTGGLGMTTLPFRFMSAPEIMIITIEGGKNG